MPGERGTELAPSPKEKGFTPPDTVCTARPPPPPKHGPSRQVVGSAPLGKSWLFASRRGAAILEIISIPGIAKFLRFSSNGGCLPPSGGRSGACNRDVCAPRTRRTHTQDFNLMVQRV